VKFRLVASLPKSYALAVLLSPCLACGQATLPVLVQTDLLDVQVSAALKRNDTHTALELLAEYRAVAEIIPPRLLFAESKVAATSGESVRALRALQDYFTTAPSSDPAYQDALRLYPSVKRRADRVRAEQEKARHQAVQTQLLNVSPSYRALMGSILDAMVDIPGGRYRMGDLNGKGKSDERPVHWVQVPAFRLAKYEVTFDQYEVFARATGRALPSDSGWGRGRHPIINVSWDDAQTFISWLDQVSGLRFRLPSEAEWEYAARAGTNSDYPWGPTPDLNRANGKHDPSVSATHPDKTAPVGYYLANAWGLYDMVGNVWEWTADCYADSYAGAPDDGSAWLWAGCERRAMRGGSWNDEPSGLRVANRDVDFPSNRFNVLGIRLAQDL
jgi:formylglycine-generating enzyme required for sulfatase activity